MAEILVGYARCSTTSQDVRAQLSALKQLGSTDESAGSLVKGVALQQLAETLTQYRFAYLLTVGDDARSHVVAVTTTMTDDTLLIAGPGRRTRANLAAHPSVTLVWAPADPRDYSLIVDGVGSLRGDELAVAPTRAVLHRPAPSQTTTTGGGCESDCVELPVAADTARS